LSDAARLPLASKTKKKSSEGSIHLDHACGNWAAEYTELHRAILAGEKPPRYAVAMAASGLSDGLTGAATVFLYALVTGRAFKWHMQNSNHGHLWEGYAQPHVNWTWAADISPPAWPFKDQDNSALYLRLLNEVRNNDTQEAESWFHHKDLRVLGEGYDTVYVWCNRGETWDLFSNPYLKEMLRAWGMRPETAFGCALNYLLDLPDEVKEHYSDALQALQDREVLKIGVQIRTGDATLDKQKELNLTDFDSFFQCAQEVEDTRAMAYPGGVLWYLVTDSLSLRHQAEQVYGDKLLVPRAGVVVGHVAKGSHAVKGVDEKAILQSAALENWLLGMVDVHIITSASGFGRTAAFRSLNWGSLYTIDYAPGRPPRQRKCGILDYDHLEVAAHTFSRI